MVVCTTQESRGRKLTSFVRKMFFEDFARFSQSKETVHRLLLPIIFGLFVKMPNFFRGVTSGKLPRFSQISVCGFVAYPQLTAITNKNV